MPLVLVGLVGAHIIALHEVGSNNPDGVEIKKKKDANGVPLDGIPFHPYYTVKDIVGVIVFLMVFSVIVFFMPEGGGYFLEYNNFDPADPLKTPPHIAPVWYFTPYYSLLRAVTYPLFGIDAKFWGVVAMGAGTLIFAFLPWLDRSPVKSIRYRGTMTKVLLVDLDRRLLHPRLPRHQGSGLQVLWRHPRCARGPAPQRLLLPVFPDDADLVFPGSLPAGA
jgi:ubiquinol-cytochrome c reductase cytochrome b subunit